MEYLEQPMTEQEVKAQNYQVSKVIRVDFDAIVDLGWNGLTKSIRKQLVDYRCVFLQFSYLLVGAIEGDALVQVDVEIEK